MLNFHKYLLFKKLELDQSIFDMYLKNNYIINRDQN